MLDNFGLGEFFFLAVLALLFFGPERLPRIGAQIGRWVSNMTQYSKAFMTQWSEEALVIQDAVDEVKGIRDEIAAARAEIASTLETARADMGEGLDVARDAVSDVKLDVEQKIDQSKQSAPLTPQPVKAGVQEIAEVQAAGKETAGGETSGEDAAISKTQEIVDGLLEKRATSGTAPETLPEAEVEDEAYLENLRAVKELMQEDKEADEVPEQEAPSEAVSVPETESPQETASVPPDTPDAPVKEEPPQESAFEKTQRILDDLRKKQAQPKEQETESEVSSPDLSADDEPAPIKEVDVGQPTGQDQVSGVRYEEFVQLNAQVTRLEDELLALRQELQALRGGIGDRVDDTAVEDADQSVPPEPPAEKPIEELV